jgi:hypothetical protein
MRYVLAALSAACCILAASAAHALVPIPVGGHPGETDVFFRLSLERGKVEPNSNEASFQKARWNMYTAGGGYTYGTVGFLQDLSFRLEGTLYDSPAEISDPERGVVSADRCRSGVVPAPGRCQFHPADRGGFVTPAIIWNFVHTGDFSFGAFLTGNIPIGVNFKKFVMPRTDFFGGGFSVGVHPQPWMTFESRTYFGSGAKLGGGTQNSTVAILNVFGFEARKWLLPWKAGFKFGTYFDGDLLNERYDDAYDQAYTPGYPASRDRIRMMRFGLAVFPYMQITDSASLELSYVQKVFGYDTPATQFYTATTRVAF